MHLRAQLMLEIESVAKADNMPQVVVAALFGVSQLRVSNLLHSRIDLVTVYTLINQLSRLRRRVDLVVTIETLRCAQKYAIFRVSRTPLLN